MSYHLGVDLGTSYTAAAICRNGVLEMVSLGTRSLEIPSVVYLDTGGTLLIGEAAERRGATDPTRIAREYKRRLGDPAPILVAGTPFAAEALMGAVLRSVVAEVTARQGEPPAHVTLTRPANWGPYKQELFGHVPALADLGPSSTATEPEAAAVHFASTTRVTSGQVVAVYDLGGGTFDAAVLRKTDLGFTTLGTPEGIEHLGGADFDDAVFEYVRRALGPAFAELDPTDPAVRIAAARLRTECVLAKESLSRDTEATIPVALPGLQTEVRLTRQDFEELVRPSLMATVESLRRSVRSAGVSPDDVAATVLAGGSSRIPLAAELITGELQLPVAVGTHPSTPSHSAPRCSPPATPSAGPGRRADRPVRPRHGRGALRPGAGRRGGPAAGRRADHRARDRGHPGRRCAGSEVDDPHPSDPSATGSGLFGLPNNTGVLENTRRPSSAIADGGRRDRRRRGHAGRRADRRPTVEQHRWTRLRRGTGYTGSPQRSPPTMAAGLDRSSPSPPDTGRPGPRARRPRAHRDQPGGHPAHGAVADPGRRRLRRRRHRFPRHDDRPDRWRTPTAPAMCTWLGALSLGMRNGRSWRSTSSDELQPGLPGRLQVFDTGNDAERIKERAAEWRPTRRSSAWSPGRSPARSRRRARNSRPAA